MTLAEALKSARDSRPQEEVAAKCDVSQATISSWEAGETRPRYGKLPAVAKAYGLALRQVKALWLRGLTRLAA